jgi:hypothetical protein
MQGESTCCLKLKDLELREIGSGPAGKIEHKGGSAPQGTGVFQLVGLGLGQETEVCQHCKLCK